MADTSPHLPLPRKTTPAPRLGTWTSFKERLSLTHQGKELVGSGLIWCFFDDSLHPKHRANGTFLLGKLSTSTSQNCQIRPLVFRCPFGSLTGDRKYTGSCNLSFWASPICPDKLLSEWAGTYTRCLSRSFYITHRAYRSAYTLE